MSIQTTKRAVALFQFDDFLSEVKDLITQSVKEAILSGLATREPKDAEETLLSRTETACLLNISLPTLAKYTLDGKIKASKIGRKILYNKVEVLKNIKCN